MTRRAIGHTRFPERKRGYNAFSVDSFLADIADLRDKGFAPENYTQLDRTIRRRLVRGYDPEAVERYVAQLPREADEAHLRTLPALPTLVVHHVRSLDRAQRRQYDGERQAEHRRVSDLPGLRLKRTGSDVKVAGTVSDNSDEVLLTRRRRAITLATGQVLRLDYTGPRGTRPRYELQLTDPTTAEPVLWIRGKHHSWGADGRVLFPGQRCLTFPVSGTSQRNAVMTAVSESGTTMLWFRHIRRYEYDVVVNPDGHLTPEILCVIELTARWLVDYFRTQG
jgi:DivIVA domain-containing protein